MKIKCGAKTPLLCASQYYVFMSYKHEAHRSSVISNAGLITYNQETEEFF